MVITVEKESKPWIVSRPWVIKVDGRKMYNSYSSRKKAVQSVEDTGNTVENAQIDFLVVMFQKHLMDFLILRMLGLKHHLKLKIW